MYGFIEPREVHGVYRMLQMGEMFQNQSEIEGCEKLWLSDLKGFIEEDWVEEIHHR